MTVHDHGKHHGLLVEKLFFFLLLRCFAKRSQIERCAVDGAFNVKVETDTVSTVITVEVLKYKVHVEG